MFGIVGTIPDNAFPLVAGQAAIDDNHIMIEKERVAINRGTPALIAAALETLQYLKQPNPFCYLVGDIGDGEGCKRLYSHQNN